ncbi:MAG: riboflavin synthase [Candidatus Kapabacteria bacterium]|nr:riboflavin synthase [Candidatus Kapabacteria bacterium]
MFTGLIEEIGIINSITSIGGGYKISVKANHMINDLAVDDSVSINGACQTVVQVKGNIFEVEAVEETLRKTTLGSFRNGKKVNLERALTLNKRLGGHIVLGHIDCVGIVKSIQPERTGILIEINYPQEFSKYVINTGSICMDGVSLTTAKAENDWFLVSIIPHTWNNTTLNLLKVGDKVNLEFDVIGKYVESLLKNTQSADNKDENYWKELLLSI